MLLTPGFVSTVIFFHQIHIATVKGWTLMEMAPGYTFFATATVGRSLLCRLGLRQGRRTTPAPLYPDAHGLRHAAHRPRHAGLELVWSAGALRPHSRGVRRLLGVFLPVAYGTRFLGSIRSLATTVMVISTAIGPGITGLLIDAGIDFPTQSFVMSAWCVVFSGLSFAITRRLLREQ